MTRILVTREDGEVFWNESVHARDFETEHFRRCLADRLGWAVADAEQFSLPPSVATLPAHRLRSDTTSGSPSAEPMVA
jgi:hypothetical protein